MKTPSSAGRVCFYVSLLSGIVVRLPGYFLDFAAPVLWPYIVHDGIKILDPRPVARENFTRLVQEGLEFIALHDPARYKRVCREIGLIMNLPTLTGAHYSRPFKVCCLDEAAFRRLKDLDGNVGALACVLVHESVHGHLFSKKIFQTRNNYSRVEDICNRDMLRFAKRISYDTEGWIDGPAIPSTFLERASFAVLKAKKMYREDKRR